MEQTKRRPVLIYDGDCGFCRKWIGRWKRVTGGHIDYAPYQEIAQQYPSIPAKNFDEAVHLIEPDGRVSRGAEAVFRSLAWNRHYAWLLWMYLRFPGIRFLSDRAYRFIAEHRVFVSRLTRWF